MKLFLGDFLLRIFFVGGFLELLMVLKVIRELFLNKKVIVFVDFGLVVLKGVVLFGYDLIVIFLRISWYFIGFEVNVFFIEGLYFNKYKVKILGGEVKC